MRPELRRFFDSMAEYFEDRPDALDRLFAAHPGWDAPRSRVAMYGAFACYNVRAALEKLFPLCHARLLDRGWDELVRAYTATRPGRHFEPTRVGEAFPSFVADQARQRDLPAWAPALARFEWVDFATSTSTAPLSQPVDRLTVNPTLEVLDLPYRICAFARSQGRGEPEKGAETALLWRHPERLVTMYMAANDRSLLVLKMAVEGLSIEDVAAATGAAESDLRAVLESNVTDGLVLSPRG